MPGVTSVTFHPLFQDIKTDLQATLDYLQGFMPPEALALAEAGTFSLATPGKMVRPAMVHLMWQALTCTPSTESVVKLAAATELIHLATLLHDDVLDESDLRRGNPTVRQQFGNRIAILGGDWLLAKASETLASLGRVDLVDLYAKVLAELCDGEVLQQSLAFEPIADISWDTYLQKTHKKTASLYVTACHATALLAECDPIVVEEAKAYGAHFGLAFQLQDDMLDYTGNPAVTGKPVLDDIRNGLANAPLLLGYQNPEHRKSLAAALEAIYAEIKQPETDETGLTVACERLKQLLENGDALDQTQECINTYCQQAKQVLSRWPDSPARTCLTQLAAENAKRPR
jgi:geranylgeranyl pyrophosphate synthase